MEDEPFIKKQIDSFCQIAMILESKNAKIDKKMLSKCEDDIEDAVMNDDFDGFQERYTGIFDKDTMAKTNAIESIIIDLMKDVPDSAIKTE